MPRSLFVPIPHLALSLQPLLANTCSGLWYFCDLGDLIYTVFAVDDSRTIIGLDVFARRMRKLDAGDV